MLQAKIIPYTLIFNEPSGTSRGILIEKPSWFVRVFDSDKPDVFGLGEISVIPKLSPECAIANLDEVIARKVADIDNVDIADDSQWQGIPAIRFGIETALRDLKNGGKRILFDSDFAQGKCGIFINGLVWMGDIETMRQRVQEKYDMGFRCIKLKIGALNFDNELKLIEFVRNEFPEVEIRLDANGAFAPEDAMKKLEKLATFGIHSIEQPIKAGQWKTMAEICRQSPIDIALDEELIGVEQRRTEMLETIRPKYIILKPSLIGGLAVSEKWIEEAKSLNIGWWATSALESNIGLNAIAQWVYTQRVAMSQGLGTGMIYSNNIPSPLAVSQARLWHTMSSWNLTNIENVD